MKERERLFLFEELVLLALKDEEGTFQPAYLETVVSASILAELLLDKRIGLTTDKSPKVDLLDDSKTNNELIDECLLKIVEDKKQRALSHWVSQFSHLRELRHRVARHLCDQGILRVDEKKVLWIFSKRVYPELNPIPEEKIIKRLREAIFESEADVDPRTAVLISLAKNAGLLVTTFGKSQCRDRKERIERVVNGELIGNAAQEVIQAANAAIMAAVIVPTIITTTVIN